MEKQEKLKPDITQFIFHQIYFYFWPENPLSDFIDDLGPGQLFFLLSLYPEKKISPNEAALKSKVGKSRIANVSKDMEKKGYITHVQDENDKRRKYFILTKKGQGLAALLCRDIDNYIQNLKKELGEEELSALVSSAKSVADLTSSYFLRKRNVLEKHSEAPALEGKD